MKLYPNVQNAESNRLKRSKRYSVLGTQCTFQESKPELMSSDISISTSRLLSSGLKEATAPCNILSWILWRGHQSMQGHGRSLSASCPHAMPGRRDSQDADLPCPDVTPCLSRSIFFRLRRWREEFETRRHQFLFDDSSSPPDPSKTVAFLPATYLRRALHSCGDASTSFMFDSKIFFTRKALNYTASTVMRSALKIDNLKLDQCHMPSDSMHCSDVNLVNPT